MSEGTGDWPDPVTRNVRGWQCMSAVGAARGSGPKSILRATDL